jgi:hypothetical protein
MPELSQPDMVRYVTVMNPTLTSGECERLAENILSSLKAPDTGNLPAQYRVRTFPLAAISEVVQGERELETC